MIDILNNLTKEYDVILDGLENYLTLSGNDALTKEVICKNLNHRYKKMKNKNEEKKGKEKVVIRIKTDTMRVVSTVIHQT